MGSKLAGGPIRGEDQEERWHTRKTSTKGQHRKGYIGSQKMKRLGTGGRISGGDCGKGAPIRQGAALAPLHGRGTSGHTQN